MAFTRLINTSFKTVGHHQIKADVLLPPHLKPGKHPLIIAYHGGFLIAGARNFYLFMAAWVPAYAAATSAIIVSPDYRLFPSASTSDILSDVEDLWQWVHVSLPRVLSTSAPGHEVDLERILVEGNSAGGFCAAHLSMNHAASIRAAIMVYPMLDCLGTEFPGWPLESLGVTAPFTGKALDDKIEEIRRAGAVSGRDAQDGLPLVLSILKGKKFVELFGNDERHNPLRRARDLKQALPRT